WLPLLRAAAIPGAWLVRKICTRGWSLRVADGPAHQVLHQRDLEVIEIERRGALHGRLAGEHGDLLVAWTARHGLLGGLQSPRHAFDRTADQADVADHPILETHR